MRKLLLIALLLIPVAGLAQSTCTTSSPCAQVTITNPNSLPSTAIVWVCSGGTATCSQSNLAAAIAQQTATNLCPAVQSTWTCHSFSQTKNPQAYNDPEPYGALMNYAAQATTSGGGVSAASPIVIFQMPQAPAQVPSVSVVLVTSGNVGPQ